jgi:hypothetical protein
VNDSQAGRGPPHAARHAALSRAQRPLPCRASSASDRGPIAHEAANGEANSAGPPSGATGEDPPNGARPSQGKRKIYYEGTPITAAENLWVNVVLIPFPDAAVSPQEAIHSAEHVVMMVKTPAAVRR